MYLTYSVREKLSLNIGHLFNIAQQSAAWALNPLNSSTFSA